ncbi:hypothetical protein MAR_031843, partial [Mya arenaria]
MLKDGLAPFNQSNSCHIYGYAILWSLMVSTAPNAICLLALMLADWSNISKVVLSHMKSEAYLSNCDSADHFLAIMKGEKKDILCSMSSQYNVVVEKNRKILVSIIEAIVFCGKQNIALRGHEGDKRNFQALLSFQAKQDPILKEHLEQGDPRSMYLKVGSHCRSDQLDHPDHPNSPIRPDHARLKANTRLLLDLLSITHDFHTIIHDSFT